MKEKTVEKLKRNVMLKKILEKLIKLEKEGQLDFFIGFSIGAAITGFPLLIVALILVLSYEWPVKYIMIIAITLIALLFISNIIIAINGVIKNKKNKNDELKI